METGLKGQDVREIAREVFGEVIVRLGHVQNGPKTARMAHSQRNTKETKGTEVV